jgi:hypothetical protein
MLQVFARGAKAAAEAGNNIGGIMTGLYDGLIDKRT